ncbi:MAG: hypothetical protein SFW35_04525 [Chitinophagales bacterium]|nr:hypothetical protein [Chitinophagales bacterium]
MALLYLPFFLIAYIAEYFRGDLHGGFSEEYVKWIVLGAGLYASIGLLLLRWLLDRFFNPIVSGLTLLAIFLGTNLLFYTFSSPSMPHVYGFTLLLLWLYCYIKWLERPTISSTIIIGLLSGIIALVRPTNVFILVFIPLWGLSTENGILHQIGLLFSRRWKLLLMGMCFFIPWIPQFIYWHYQAGNWLFFSYQHERFFWDDPEIINGLFSYKKGWLLYTPVMVLAWLGLPLLNRYVKAARWAVPALLFLSLYVLMCWWSWWYGGSYGNRAFIDLYGLLALPLAASIQFCYDKGRNAAIAASILVLFFIGHNIFQMEQYKHGAIHYIAMTKEAYWDSFGRIHPSKTFDTLLNHKRPRQPELNEPEP